jgi:hypothetical protein
MGDDDGSDEVAAIGTAWVSEQRIVPMDDRTRSLVKSICDWRERGLKERKESLRERELKEKKRKVTNAY